MAEPWLIHEHTDSATYRSELAKLRQNMKGGKITYRASLKYLPNGPILLDMEDYSIQCISWGSKVLHVEESWINGSIYEIYIWHPLDGTRAIFQFQEGRLKYWHEDNHYFRWVTPDIFAVRLVANFRSLEIEYNTVNNVVLFRRNRFTETYIKGDGKNPHMKIDGCITFEKGNKVHWHIIAGPDIFKWFPRDISWIFTFSEITRIDIGRQALSRIRIAMRWWLLRKRHKEIGKIYPRGVASLIHSYTVD